MIKKMIRNFAIVFMVSMAWVGYGQSTTAPQDIKVRTDNRPVPAQTAGPSYLLSTLNVTDQKDVFPACSGGDYYVGFQLAYDLSNNSTELAWAVDLTVSLMNGATVLWTKPLTVRMGDQTYLSTVFHNSSITCNAAYKLRIDAKTLSGTVPQTIVSVKVLLFKKFENVFSPSGAVTVNSTYSNGTNTVSWNPHAASVPATLGYDVEWVYIEQYEGFAGTAAQAFAFKEPVRITTSATSYTHLMYYPTGQIYYRVRAIGFDPSYPDHRLKGNWFYTASPISITNHNSGYTWQLQTIFAEEGKNKKIMSYYDGTLRQRQILTNLSSENVTVVEESAYDYEGRKAIDILPVPVTAIPVTWQNMVGVTLSGATLTKPSGTALWNAGAASVQQIPANASGWLEIPITSITGNRMIGLSDADTDQNCTSIDYAFYLNGSSLRVYENCTSKFVVAGTLVIGDFVQIERIGSTVVYKKNGVIVYTSLTASTSVLIADASINTVGGTIGEISISDSPLKFKPEFNRFESKSALVAGKVSGTKKKFHYDNRDTLNSVVSTLGGAGKYYSPLTAPPGTLKDYIPDAEGYVFSQTEYLNDGTGRIARQSGVGKAFRMDDPQTNQAHVTKNFYNTAAPEELQRLFGNNVGNASHYKKNLVVDPNGQVSVSYLDQEDRVIATALAGEKPTNVNGLPSYNALGSDLIAISLNAKNQKKDGLSITSHKIGNVAVNSGYTFTYDLSALASEVETVGCVACGFDLTITVTDPNGNALNLSSQPGNESLTDNFIYARNNISAVSCSTPLAINTVEINLTLPLIGDYTVTKTLKAKELTFESVSEIISQTETIQELIEEITVSYELDSADCEVCTTCDAEDAINEAIEEIAELDCENILQRIIHELKMDSLAVDSLSTYEPTQEHIEAHPSYCEYELCVKNQANDAFEKQLARVADWDAAVLLNYHELIDEDPFFNVDTLSGDGYKDEMEDLINDIYITKVDGDDLRGTLLDVTDPSNDDFYVDEEGHADPTNGYHVLYIEYMKAGYLPTSPEIKEQRWELYKALYLEAKRKIKLTIPDFINCDSAFAKIQMQDGLPTTPDDIQAYSDANGVSGNVSDEEVSSSFYTIRNICPNAVISPSDSLTITSHLESYFNNHPDNFYRIIILSDLNEDPDLTAIQTILTPKGCGLDSVALVDPVTCARDTTIVYSQYSQILDEDCVGCRQAAAVSPEVESLQKAKMKNIIEGFRNDMITRKNDKDGGRILRIDSLISSRIKERLKRNEQEKKGKGSFGSNAMAVDPNARKRPGESQNLITAGEYAALMAIYSSTNGSGWTHKNGWSTANPLVPQDVTGWYGITVNGSGNVIGLNLNGNNLTGSIPSQIGNLSNLVNLSMNTNYLTGSIPTTIGNLSNLQQLDIWNNQLTGSIPTQVGNLSNLTGLSLSANQLSGSLPTQLGNLTNLTYLSINSNPLLTGSIPTTLGLLSNLQIMELAGNGLTGSIPSQLGNLTQLEVLTMHSNQLSGSIPASLGSLVNLVSLNLYHNQLTGAIPPQLGDLVNLEVLSLGVNQLSSSIPTNLGDLSNLTYLTLYNNQLTGSIPASLGSLTNLQYLELNTNQLSGSIPYQLGSLSQLKTLLLNNNSLSGSIPYQLGSLSNLLSLYLYENDLTGSIPAQLGNLDKVTALYLSYNQLTGSIPGALGNMDVLQVLSLENNQLSGSIPANLGNLSTLVSLAISTNSLSGSIPPEMGDLENLEAFHAQYNGLTGSIPAELGELENLRSLSLFSNNLTGKIPASLGNLSELTAMFLHYNQLSDTIPASLGNLSKLVTLELENNALVGPIPATLGQLNKLTSLGLHNNQLTGSIPKQLGNMSKLTSFNVFNNKLTGSVPASFANLKDLEVLAINYNYLTGNLPKLDPAGMVLILADYNKFTFTNILPLKQSLSPSTTFQYAPQDSVDQKKKVYGALGTKVKLISNVDRASSPSSKYEWFKNGVSLGAPSTTKHTLTIPSMSMSDVATYHYRITNPGATILTLVSRPQQLVLSDSLISFTYCLEYDSANETLSRFKFVVDWNTVVQQCMENAAKEDSILISRSVEILMDEQATLFYSKQSTNCLDSITENFYYEYVPKEYHYTLYYYDQAGNLVQTVSPAGVDTEDQDHRLITRSKYNSINQLVWQKTPDAGESQRWYDNKGQLRLSQNAQQLKEKKYSYTKFDNFGRMTEIGEMYTLKHIDTLKTKLEALTFPTASVNYVLLDRQVTHYDFIKPSIQGTFLQQYVRNRVSYIEIYENGGLDTISTYFSYDVQGHVKSLLQRIPELGNKRIDYVYGVLSGKVDYAVYQYGKSDQFIHKYIYDADNRIKEVFTSIDAFLFDKEVDYKYYQHGPLSRVVLGEYTGSQGLDYYYTLQNWIKGINMPYAADPSNDGNSTSRVGRDAFAYAIGYYNGDYKPRNSSKIISGVRDSLWVRYNAMYSNQGYYNGNIAWMETDLKKIGQQKGARVKGMQAMMYRYDQLNRIIQSRSLTNYSAANSKFIARAGTNEAYDENFTYDPNGNLLTLDRRDNAAAVLDNFNYSYYTNTNKLRYLNPVTVDTTYSGNIYSNEKLYDGITVANTANVPNGGNPTLRATGSIDFDAAFDLNDNAAGFRAYIIGEEEGEFNYDAIGNLVRDMGNGVHISWTPYGKIRNVWKVNGDSILYRYDAMGNRVEKKTITGGVTNITRYVRDASGNVMGTYHTGSALPVEWINPVNVAITGTTVSKPAGSGSWNAGVSSLQILPAGVNGYIEFKVTSLTGNRMIGFNDADVDANYTGIEYIVYMNGNNLRAYANGAQVYDAGAGSLALNDVLKLERIGTTVYLRKNGTLVYTYLVASTTNLIADISISTVGSSIEGVKYFFGDVIVTEQPIYGSARLGVYRGYRQAGVRQLGHKGYELSNHLGNVLAVVTDNVRVRVSPDSAWAVVLNSNDYYAFGSEMPTRTYSMHNDYRYGFNGKEQDTENTWGDDIYDYGFRIYNPKIGKFLSVDPLANGFPMLSPYQYAGNNPISAIDLDGLEKQDAIDKQIENLGYQEGLEILTSSKTAAATAIKTEIIWHAGRTEQKVSLTIVQTTYKINGKGEIEYVSEGFTDVQMNIAIDGTVKSTNKRSLCALSSNSFKNEDGVVLIDGMQHAVKFSENPEKATRLAADEPVILAFAELIKKQPDKVKAGETSFNDPFTTQNIFSESLKLFVEAIDFFAPGDPVPNPATDNLKDKAFDKIEDIKGQNRVFVPKDKLKEATKSFEHDAEYRIIKL